jgi:hypothetical protein
VNAGIAPEIAETVTEVAFAEAVAEVVTVTFGITVVAELTA